MEGLSGNGRAWVLGAEGLGAREENEEDSGRLTSAQRRATAPAATASAQGAPDERASDVGLADV